MKPYRLILPLAFALTAFAAGGAVPAASADVTCAQRTNVYFYTNDSQDLSRQLAANAASCTDYWVSITPYTAGPNLGKPKGSPALPVVHQQGPQFHGLAEIRMKAWCLYAETHTWYATGQMLHDWMLVEGYDPTRDTWAVNEVGWPSDDPCNTGVFDDAAGARLAFQDFVRGLYDGYAGETPMAGVVFAASPIQMTPDLTSYEEGLAQWYADSSFWQDMNRYIAVWAQETYADARSWGVDGSTIADRAAALNAYFLHAQKMAANGGEATAAVRDFFAHAYTPLGNGSYRWGIPTPPGPASGYTDIGYPSLIFNFISAETYALRSSMGNRFGFAVTSNNPGGASIRRGVEAHIGAAIRDSQDEPLGACTAAGETCDGAVIGGVFPETWPNFATPPTITPHIEGQLSPSGWYTGDVQVTWDVADAQTPDSIVTSGCDPVTITSDTTGTPLVCTATSSGGWAQQTVTIRRDATPPAITCTPTPATLWPPNGKLVLVSVEVNVTDETSGPDGFLLTAAPATDAADFTVGEPDTAGLLRAQRPGNGGDREYTLTYTAGDVAGNSAKCDATVLVPHDQGH
jgi:hypothetical protein